MDDDGEAGGSASDTVSPEDDVVDVTGEGFNSAGFPKCPHNFIKNTKYAGIDPANGDKAWSDCHARSFHAYLLVFARLFHAHRRAKSLGFTDPASTHFMPTPQGQVLGLH